MNILGKTIKSIALEKAGIIKENTPVVISRQAYKCNNIFRKAAKYKNADIFDIAKFFKLTGIKPSYQGITADFTFNKIKFSNFTIPVFGKHQIYNFVASLLTVFIINKNIIDIIKTKPLGIRIPGRIELLQYDPPIILDVSHNADSAKKLVETLKLHFPKVKWIILAGMTEDKDYAGFFRHIKNISSEIVITSPSKFKKSLPDEVYKIAKVHFRNSIFIESIDEAIAYVLNKKCPLLVTGSFYVAGPFIEHFNT
jgi:dihydrofolate synthase/folylpolyglutamate synthase